MRGANRLKNRNQGSLAWCDYQLDSTIAGVNCVDTQAIERIDGRVPRKRAVIMDAKNDLDAASCDNSGALMVLDEKERKLVMLLISKTLMSENGKRYITARLGARYIEIGERLLNYICGQ